jgi:2-methylcitrate dehydratase PrpD
VEENPEFSAQSAQKRIANVMIFKKDGSFCQQRVDYAKGDPENPMSREDIRRKAEQLLGRGVAYALALRAYRKAELTNN